MKRDVPLPGFFVSMRIALLARGTSSLSTEWTVQGVVGIRPVLTRVFGFDEIVPAVGNESANADGVVEERRTVDRERILPLSISCRCNDRRSVLDGEPRLVGGATVATAIPVGLFMVVDPDGEVQNISALATRVGDSLYEIAPLREPILGDYSIEIERRFGCEISCQFEDVLPVACRVRGIVRDVIFLLPNVEQLAQVFTGFK